MPKRYGINGTPGGYQEYVSETGQFYKVDEIGEDKITLEVDGIMFEIDKIVRFNGETKVVAHTKYNRRSFQRTVNNG